MSDDAKRLLEGLKKWCVENEGRWQLELLSICHNDESWSRLGILDVDPVFKQMYTDAVFMARVMTERRLQLCEYLKRQVPIETPTTDAMQQSKCSN